ncbi:MAG: acyl carrier protein [Lachnospiraceae bacterium]|nr:acyl carrier protein [Lachnospiraceae bacterium]
MNEFLAMLQQLKPHVDFASGDDLVESGVLDSLDIFDIIEAIEATYGVEIDGEDVDPDHFVSAEHMWRLVQRYLEQTN